MIEVFSIDLINEFVIIYPGSGFPRLNNIDMSRGGMVMATRTNFILKVSDAKLADVQKALKDANINVVSILEVHKEEA